MSSLHSFSCVKEAWARLPRGQGEQGAEEGLGHVDRHAAPHHGEEGGLRNPLPCKLVTLGAHHMPSERNIFRHQKEIRWLKKKHMLKMRHSGTKRTKISVLEMALGTDIKRLWGGCVLNCF